MGKIEKDLRQKRKCPPMKGIIEWTMEKDDDGTNTKKKSNIEKKTEWTDKKENV